MRRVSNAAIDLIQAGFAACSAEGAGRAFFDALQPFGLKALYARAYSALDPVEPAHIYARIRPERLEIFVGQPRFRRANFVARACRGRAAPFTWAEIRKVSAEEQELWQFAIDEGYGDGLAVPCHGPHGYVGVVSLGFEDLRRVAPAEIAAIEVASMVLHERMRSLATAAARPGAAQLSRRERDCLAFIAEGRTDAEIGVVLGISKTTAHSYVESAKRRLGAVMRAQAVAIALASGLLYPDQEI